jgi:opacity protein-like surface antigen
MKNYLFIFIFLPAVIYSQSKFSFSAFGGYTFPLSNMKGEYPSEYYKVTDDTKNTYLLKDGFNFGIKGKYLIDTTDALGIVVGLNYNYFSQNKDYTTGTLGRSIKNRMSVFTISGGFQYDFNPRKQLNPFTAAEIMVNFFGGKVDVTGDTLNLRSRKSETRYGLIFTAGLEYRISKNWKVTAGVKYAFANLFGKENQSSPSSSLLDAGETGTSGSSEIPLNDYGSSGYEARSINFLQTFAGISFSLDIFTKK